MYISTLIIKTVNVTKKTRSVVEFVGTDHLKLFDTTKLLL